MTTPFPEWLGRLAKAEKGPVSLPDAVRDQAYSHLVKVQGNWSTATLTGEVRSAPDADTALLAFTIGTPTFDGSHTSWSISLSEGWATSAGFPADDSLTGVQYFPYDFLLKPQGGNAERLIGGLFPVSGHITEPA